MAICNHECNTITNDSQYDSGRIMNVENTEKVAALFGSEWSPLDPEKRIDFKLGWLTVRGITLVTHESRELTSSE